ncbi:MAG TPA: protoporphyrinogen oxidase HemJ [Pseudolabrys sp.]
MTAVYPWFKALHIIAVIAWMAGMLYLPRLFVYHTTAKPDSALSETFKTMERRLLTFIMLPAMIVSWIVGIVLLLQGQWLSAGWLHAKLVAVVAMTILHGLFAHWVNEFRFDRNRHSQKFYRIVNEIPTALLIVIVVLAAVKPF